MLLQNMLSPDIRGGYDKIGGTGPHFRCGLGLILGLFVALMLSVDCQAEPYRIGPEDVLEIRFWQDPTLNAQVRVRDDGKIAIDIIGELQATGFRVKVGKTNRQSDFAN